MKNHLSTFLLIIGFFLILGSVGAVDCNRPFPVPYFLTGCVLAAIGFIFVDKRV